MESSIRRPTRPVQTTSMASTPQDVSGRAVGWGNHARIFVDLRLCGDRYACRLLTPLSAPAPTVLTSSKLRIWHALKGRMKEDKTFRQGSWTVNCRLTTEKVCLFSPEGQISEIAKYAAAVRIDCEKFARVQSTMYRLEVSRSAQMNKEKHSTLRSNPRISSNQVVDLCSPQCRIFMQRSVWLACAKVPRHGLDFFAAQAWNRRVSLFLSLSIYISSLVLHWCTHGICSQTTAVFGIAHHHYGEIKRHRTLGITRFFCNIFLWEERKTSSRSSFGKFSHRAHPETNYWRLTDSRKTLLLPWAVLMRRDGGWHSFSG